MTDLFRRATAILLPLAVLLTVTCGLAYAEVQQALRSGADDPQVQLAEDAAAALNGGADPTGVVPAGRVDLAVSLDPFVAVYSSADAALASNGELDGGPPVPPSGVLAAARERGRDHVTWQPSGDLRIALVVIPWKNGTVAAGRSLRLVEDREGTAMLLAGAAWLAGMVLLAGAALLAAWLWPRRPSTTTTAT